ncbi:MAG TPA: SpoIID/LytB domain-containing protein [Ignavibacteriaceae bacterium]|nr:SpoIID/LytB domain-containing protein [Ignavibacteriaceae bacterium]
MTENNKAVRDITFSKEPEVHVGITSESSINFELYGDFKCQGFQKSFNGPFAAELRGNNILFKNRDDEFQAGDEIIFEPTDPVSDSFLIRNITIGMDFHWEKKEKQRFIGSLKLKKDKDKIWLINIIPVEKYLQSVISSEISSKSSLQLLKAHAIISRSWLLAQMEKSKISKKVKPVQSSKSSFSSEKEFIKWYGRDDHNLFDICADDHCQRYQGITKIFTENAKQAVQQTKGIVLSNRGKICDTRYSKACGGITESFENVWEPVKYEYLSSVVDYKFPPDNFSLDFSDEKNAQKWIKAKPAAYCNTANKKILSQALLEYDQNTKDFFRWKVEYAQEEISEIIKNKTGIDFGKIVDLTPVERGASSRLIKLKITGTLKSLIFGKELEIRRILSKSHLYSSAFVVEKQLGVHGLPEKFILYGAGWGHGVGLCQIGAAVMSALGFQFDEILLHYFKDAEMRKLY